MKVESLKLYNWHKGIASFYFQFQNVVLTMGWSEHLLTSDTNLVGIWKIKKLKQ